MIYKESLVNAMRELESVIDIYIGKKGDNDADDSLVEAIHEVIYNLDLIIQGVEYKSDEYQYLAESFKEVLGGYDVG